MRTAAVCFGLLAGLVLPLALTGASGSATGAGKARTCFGERPTILGTQHGESISGTGGRDVIISLGGRDSINARQGKDYVCAGSGADVVHGSEGVNHLNGGPGDDWLDGRRAHGNVVIGGKGEDYVQAEGKIDGGAGNDWIESYGYFPPSKSPVPGRLKWRPRQGQDLWLRRRDCASAASDGTTGVLGLARLLSPKRRVSRRGPERRAVEGRG